MPERRIYNERQGENNSKFKGIVGSMAEKGLLSMEVLKEKIAQIRVDDLVKTSEKKSSEGYRVLREKVRNISSFGDKRKVIKAVLITTGLSMFLSGSADNNPVSQKDITEALINPPTPITQQAPADIILNGERDSIFPKLNSKEVVPQANITPSSTTTLEATITPSTTTTLEATITPSSTATPEATLIATSTPEEPFNFGGIDFTRQKEIVSLDIDVNGVTLDSSFIPAVYYSYFNDDGVEIFLKKIKPGEGTAAVDKDKYGNTILYVHSGYKDQHRLEAEELRYFIEGESKNPILSGEQREEKMQSLVGQEVQAEQGGTVNKFTISAVGYISHDRKDDFEKASQTVSGLDVLIDATGGKGKSPFEKYLKENKNAIFLTFCGWGPKNEDDWWVYSRYVIALEPAE